MLTIVKFDEEKQVSKVKLDDSQEYIIFYYNDDSFSILWPVSQDEDYAELEDFSKYEVNIDDVFRKMGKAGIKYGLYSEVEYQKWWDTYQEYSEAKTLKAKKEQFERLKKELGEV